MTLKLSMCFTNFIIPVMSLFCYQLIRTLPRITDELLGGQFIEISGEIRKAVADAIKHTQQQIQCRV